MCHLLDIGMDREDAEHDLVRPQGPEQLQPLDECYADILDVAQTLAAHTNTLLLSIFWS